MQLIEVSGDRRYLSVHRGFLSIKRGEVELGKVAFDNILGVIGAGHGITLSQSLLVRLANLGIPYVVCDQRFSPVSVTWPLSGHHNQSKVVRKQLCASLPLKKRIWQSLVRAKIQMQAQVLITLGQESTALTRMIAKVKSGDPENLEAQAARIYWGKLFGPDFRRSREGATPNDLLNYGYTIFRSTVARAVVACGLHPSVGVCHRNQYNPFVLVDDLLEPFRPFVDLKVKTISASHNALNQECKHALVELLHVSVSAEQGSTSLLKQVQHLARSISHSFLEGKPALVLPKPTNIELTTLLN